MYDAGQAWHYVTLGLTELYDQSDASVGPNGIRCELSMRVAKGDVDRAAALAGRLPRKDRLPRQPGRGHGARRLVPNRPDPGAPATAGLEGAVALLDPAIEPRPGPFGKVGVILLVGLTARQLDEIKQGGSAKVIADIAADPAKQITSAI